MEEQLRILVALGLVLILVLLRLDSRRFGVGEYDVPDEYGESGSFLVRLAWYAAGIVLVVAVYVVYPGDRDALGLLPPNRIGTLLLGIGAGVLGIAQAVAIAYLRFGGPRLPRLRDVPDGIVNALGTALVDEAIFRGIILGLLLVLGVEPLLAILIQAFSYVLATRVGRSGGDWYLVLLDLAIGLIGGWLTFITGGIAAAFIAHAVTRLAVFFLTGSADAAGTADGYLEDEGPTDWEFGDDAIPEEVGVGPALAGPTPWARGPVQDAVAPPAASDAVVAPAPGAGSGTASAPPVAAAGPDRDAAGRPASSLDALLPDGGLDDSESSLP
jgi:membrane protease YdiL (CAAX protease family)